MAIVEERAVAYRQENGLTDDARVPVDAVTASGSGLDPHISVANARLQAARVAGERGLVVEDVLAVIDDNTVRRPLGILGDEGVNVLLANLDLDELSGS
jgi:K+-transporting ATPase ATPase C chain